MQTEDHISLEEIPFSLDHTLGCGQAFRWKRDRGIWKGVAGNRYIQIWQKGNMLFFTGAEEEYIRNYFQLDLDLESVLSGINRDTHISSAIENCYGLRIIKQPEWECIASYICATNMNIPRIMGCIEKISKRLGRKIPYKKEEIFEFPHPTDIAGSDLCNLCECRLGYRAEYLYETARHVLEFPELIPSIYKLPYEKAKTRLMEMKGIGPKAADCILLFAFNKYESFPVDVWIRRIMNRYYLASDLSGPLSLNEYKKTGDFARDYFGSFAGYAQEYLFCNRNSM